MGNKVLELTIQKQLGGDEGAAFLILIDLPLRIQKNCFK